MRHSLSSRLCRPLAILAAMFLPVVLPACQDPKPGAPAGAKETDKREEMPEALADFVVKAGDTSLVFQYVDPSTGQFATTQDVGKVPEAARPNVIVFSSRIPKGSMPPELVVLADLTAPGEDGTYPFRLVSRYGAVTLPQKSSGSASGTGTAGGAQPLAAGVSGDSVILFSTKWCPHCRHAKEWLTQQGIPFVEKDVESDATATTLLQQMGQSQGVPPQMLTSVPILAVKGKLVMGFDPQKIQQLLK